MKSKSFMLMILSMGFGLIAAIGISQVMGRSNSTETPVQQMGTVLVAAEDMDINSHLTEENVKLENWPLEIIPEGAITSIDEIGDMGIRTRLSKGMPIQQSSIANIHKLGDLDIPDGFKVVPIKVGGDDLIGGLLSAGDKVDVIGLFKKRNKFNQQQTTTRTFLKALRVFSVNTQTRARENRSEGVGGGAVVGLLVTEKQSEDIFYVQRTGEIKLVLRGDRQLESDDKVEDLSDILDWDDEEDEDEATEVVAEEPNKPTFAGFGMNSGALQESSMIVWVGNSPEKITFHHGAPPSRSGNSVIPQAPERSSANEADDEDWDEEEDFGGSDEIDRSVDSDQYRGL